MYVLEALSVINPNNKIYLYRLDENTKSIASGPNINEAMTFESKADVNNYLNLDLPLVVSSMLLKIGFQPVRKHNS